MPPAPAPGERRRAACGTRAAGDQDRPGMRLLAARTIRDASTLRDDGFVLVVAIV